MPASTTARTSWPIAHDGLAGAEPADRRHEEHERDAEDEQADQPLALGVPGGGGNGR